MPPADEAPGKFRIDIGSVDRSQVIVGDHNKVEQFVGLSVAETEQLLGVFAGFRSTVAEQAPPELREEAIGQAAELEQAIVAGEPDAGRVRRVVRWFRQHAPQLAGAAMSVVVNPLVGKLVEAAGEAVADRFGRLVREEL